MERVEKAAWNVNISLIKSEGLTTLAPGVIMFYGVRRNDNLLRYGISRPEKFLALVGETISIEYYEN